ncbi:MAG TPA: Hsp70 family protein [Myxococcota bacterium]|nr:Hsp70 family protein [Myxococcota bacterium]
MAAFGVDFGTTNSALARAEDDGPARVARFARGGGQKTQAFRSVVYFEPPADGRGPPAELAGPRAIARYLAAEEPGRLVQSLKSFLAARDFSATRIFEREYRLEALIAVLLRALLREAQADLGELEGTVVVGRPVRFVSARAPEDEELALARLRAAFATAGVEDIAFEYEPVAAAYHYERGLDHDELILIGDFGGGTSDFSLVRVGPGARAAREARGAKPVLGNAGVPVAGDVFDGRIVRALVAPALGLGAEYRSVFGRVLPVPRWIYGHLERWHHLSFLRTPRTLALLYDLQREALEPQRFEALVHVVQEDLGFPLHRSVERAKLALTREPAAELAFAHGPVKIAEPVERAAFERWIEPELSAISRCVDGLFAECGVERGDVDRVFLTGGSSLVPAVRALFADRFGEERIRGGDELVSVASGLALRARELEAA